MKIMGFFTSQITDKKCTARAECQMKNKKRDVINFVQDLIPDRLEIIILLPLNRINS